MKLAKDKVLHFSVGALISALFAVIFGLFGLSYWGGFIVAAIAGFLKELRDSKGFGQKDFMDFWWTGLGGLVPMIFIQVMYS